MAAAPRRKTGAVRRKKTTRRRSTGRGGGAKNGKLPNWSLLVLGLAIGLLAAWVIQLVVHGMRDPESGLSNLMKPSKPSPASTATAKPKETKRAKPTYDFYTILPETETRLSDRDWDKQKRSPAERGVNYMLQAASYSSYQDADRLKARLILNGMTPSIEKVTIEGKGTFYRVRVGPFVNTAEVDRARDTLAGMGIKPMLLKIAASK